MKRLAAALALLSGCATTGPFATCNPVAVQCNPADYPPMAEMRRPWQWFVPPDDEPLPPPEPETPAGRLLRKLSK